MGLGSDWQAEAECYQAGYDAQQDALKAKLTEESKNHIAVEKERRGPLSGLWHKKTKDGKTLFRAYFQDGTWIEVKDKTDKKSVKTLHREAMVHLQQSEVARVHKDYDEAFAYYHMFLEKEEAALARLLESEYDFETRWPTEKILRRSIVSSSERVRVLLEEMKENEW